MFESLGKVLIAVEEVATKLFIERVDVAVTVLALFQTVAIPSKPVPLTLLAPAVAEIVIGELPIIVKGVQLASPEHDAVVVAKVLTIPLLPVYSPPCANAGR